MSELIAVKGVTIDHSIGSAVSGGTFTITSSESSKVKCSGSGAYSDKIQISFSGGNYSGGASGSATGSGTITATSKKVKVDGGYVMRLGDSGDLVGTYTTTSTPPSSVSFKSSIEITDAGQDKVKSN